MSRLLVLPAAPLLLPHIAQVTPDPVSDVLAACDSLLAGLATDEVTVVSAQDHLRDLGSGSQPPPRAAAVADHLLDRVGYSGVRRHVGPQDVIDGDTVLFMADGSAAVGPKAPRPGPAGETFDNHLIECLEHGQLDRLQTVADGQALAVGCVTAPVWRRLGECSGSAATCESLQTFAPYGVRYFVGAWTTEADTR